MASFLRRVVEQTGGSLPDGPDAFADDNGDTHERAINALAGAGVTGGTAENRYSPDLTVRRDQMASFLVRLLDLLVASGKGSAPAR